MFKRNQDIKTEMKQAKIPSWVVAERLGVHVNTVYSMLNKELTSAQREQLLSIIEELKQEMKLAN